MRPLRLFVMTVFLATGFLTARPESLLDPSFQLDPRVQGRIEVVKPVPDGSILIGGLFTNLTGLPSVRLLRLTSQGALDDSFKPWKPFWDWAQNVRSIELDSEGGIWVGVAWYNVPMGGTGSSLHTTSVGQFERLRSNGEPNGGVLAYPADAQVLPQDGKALLWGTQSWVQFAGGFSRPYFERRTLQGAIDPSFQFEAGFTFDRGSTSYDSGIDGLSLTSNGDLLAAGTPSTEEGRNWACLARLDPNGALRWTYQWPPPSVIPGKTAKEITGGDILLAGFDAYGGEGRVARLSADGKEDPTYLGPRQFWGVTQALIEPDGRVVVAGQFTHFLGVPRGGLAALLPDGSLDLGYAPETGFSAGTQLRSLARQEDGGILVLADSAEFDGVPQRQLFRLRAGDPAASATAPNLFFIVPQEPARERSNPGLFAVARAGRLDTEVQVRVRTVSQSAVAGQDFVPVNKVITLAAGERFQWLEVAALPDGFEEPAETFGLELIVDPASGTAAEPSVSSQPIVDQPYDLALASDQIVTDEATARIWIPGQYPFYGDVSPFRFRLRTVDGTALAGRDYVAVDWTGSWQQWPEIQILDTATYEGDRQFTVELTAVGGGVSIREPSRTTVTIRDDDTLAGPSRGIRGPVSHLLDAPDSRWLVVGNFDHVDGVPRPGLARLLDDGRLDRTFTPPPDLDGPVRTALVQDDGRVVIGGAFTRCGGVAVPGLVRLLRDGRPDPKPLIQLSSAPTNCSSGTPQVVEFIERRPDGTWWVAGSLPRFQGCGYPSQVAVFDSGGTWVRGWNHSRKSVIAAVFAVTGPDVVAVTQSGEFMYPDGSPVPLANEFQGNWRFNLFFSGRPLVRGGFVSLPDYYRPEIVTLVWPPSSQRILRITNSVATPGGTLRLDSLSGWCPLANGEVMISGQFTTVAGTDPGGALTGRIAIDGGVRAVSSFFPVGVSTLTEARDGRIAGLAGGTTVHLVRLSAAGAPKSSLGIERVVAAPDGAIHLAFQGQAAAGHTLEVSGDLKTWSPLSTSSLVNGPNVFLDPAGRSGTGRRFYRLKH